MIVSKWGYVNKAKKNKNDSAKLRITVPIGGFKPLCSCTTPPWEHCEHTSYQPQKSN